MTSSVWCLRPGIENETKATNKVILTTVIIVFVVVFVVVVVVFFYLIKKVIVMKSRSDCKKTLLVEMRAKSLLQ